MKEFSEELMEVTGKNILRCHLKEFFQEKIDATEKIFWRTKWKNFPTSSFLSLVCRYFYPKCSDEFFILQGYHLRPYR